MTFWRHVQSFSHVALQGGISDKDGLRFAISSLPWLLAVSMPGPTGARKVSEHCSNLFG